MFSLIGKYVNPHLSEVVAKHLSQATDFNDFESFPGYDGTIPPSVTVTHKFATGSAASIASRY